jgi:peptidoglycan/LPS O-acetylase OafA/YrhL
MGDYMGGNRWEGIADARAPSTPHWGAVDGLRALAVLLVLACHFKVHADGGMIGVDVFFVISGFLITTLLIAERERTGQLSLRKFWARRALRLFPALFCALALAVCLSFTSTPQIRHDTLAGIAPVAFYMGNWVRTFGSTSALGLLGHAWSLAVEEQFYLLWPIVCMVYVCRTNRGRAVYVVGAAAVADAVYLAIAMSRWGVQHTVFRTDTRGVGLLVGSALALAVAKKGGKVAIRPRPARILRVAGVAGCLLILALTPTMPVFPAQNTIVILLGTLGALALVARVVLVPGGTFNAVLESRVPRWVGRRSYGIYLYHYPLAVIFVQNSHARGLGRGVAILACTAATIVLAACSYRWVELPFLRRKKMFTPDRPRSPAMHDLLPVGREGVI